MASMPQAASEFRVLRTVALQAEDMSRPPPLPAAVFRRKVVNTISSRPSPACSPPPPPAKPWFEYQISNVVHILVMTPAPAGRRHQQQQAVSSLQPAKAACSKRRTAFSDLKAPCALPGCASLTTMRAHVAPAAHCKAASDLTDNTSHAAAALLHLNTRLALFQMHIASSLELAGCRTLLPPDSGKPFCPIVHTFIDAAERAVLAEGALRDGGAGGGSAAEVRAATVTAGVLVKGGASQRHTVACSAPAGGGTGYQGAGSSTSQGLKTGSIFTGS